MKKVRMKVLQPFTRNLGGQIVHGNPDHPEEDGRILLVDEAVAVILEKDKDAKRYSFKDEAREELEGEAGGEHEDDDDDADETGTPATGNVEGARTTGTGVEKSAQTTREKRTTPKPARRGSKTKTAPVGGTDTTASTNHPTTAANSDGTSSSTNAGLNDAPSDEAP